MPPSSSSSSLNAPVAKVTENGRHDGTRNEDHRAGNFDSPPPRLPSITKASPSRITKGQFVAPGHPAGLRPTSSRSAFLKYSFSSTSLGRKTP